MTTRGAILFAIYFTPLLLRGIYRGRVASRKGAEAEGAALPYAPPPDSTSARLLLRFDPEQRAYLRQQLKFARGLFIVFAWTELFVFAVPIFFPDPISVVMWTDPSARAWSSFLSTPAFAQRLVLIMSTAIFVVTVLSLRFGPSARFFQTRALSRGFVFWARIVPAFLAFTGAAAVGMLLAFAVLSAIKGPVWQHLPPIASSMNSFSAQQYSDLLQTSAIRMFLSSITTFALFLSAITADFCLPVKNVPGAQLPPRSLVLLFFSTAMVALALLTISEIHGWQLPRILFLYLKPGPPPPYIFALGPTAISIALLFLARRFFERVEF